MSLEIADHAYVLDDGSIVHSGPAHELVADDARVGRLRCERGAMGARVIQVRCCQGLRVRTSHLPCLARQASPCIHDELPSRSKLARNSWQVSPSSLRAAAIGVTVPRRAGLGILPGDARILPPCS